MEKMYRFRREDNGEVVEVDFATMMTQDVAGFITIDGVSARRIVAPEEKKPVKMSKAPIGRPIVSDTLGFPTKQLAEFETDRQAHGFRQVEFRPDPVVPEFCQVVCHSRDEYGRYVKHRGFVNANSIGGVRLTQEELDAAADFVKRQYSRDGTMREDPEFVERLEDGFLLMGLSDDDEEEEIQLGDGFGLEIPLEDLD